MKTEKFKKVLSDKNITIKEVAAIIGVDDSTFYRKMQCKGKKFTIEQVTKLVKKLELSISEANDIFLMIDSHIR